MTITNGTTKSNEAFLQESTDATIAAIESGNQWLAQFWARHAVSFAVSCGMVTL